MASTRFLTLALAAAFALLATSLSATMLRPQLQRVSDAQLRIPAQERPAAGDVLMLEFSTPDGSMLRVELLPQTRLLRTASAKLAAVESGKTRIYAGTVVGNDAGWARLTRVGDAWVGAVFDGTQIWFLDPASYHTALTATHGISGDATVIFSLADLDGAFDLTGDMLHPPIDPSEAFGVGGVMMRGIPEYELAVTLVLDTEYQDIHGEDSISMAIAILNVVDGFYSAQVDTRVVLHHIEVLDDNENLDTTDYTVLLPRFATFAQDKNLPFRGVSHLLSGKNFDGSVIGYAYVGRMCTITNSYGINQITNGVAFNATLLAHEMGHNYGARHDNQSSPSNPTIPSPACTDTPGIMGASISSQNPATEFSWCSQAWFSTFLSVPRACLVPSALPFADGFEAVPD